MKIEFYRKKTGKAVKGRYVVDEDGDVFELNGNSFGGVDVTEVHHICWRIKEESKE